MTFFSARLVAAHAAHATAPARRATFVSKVCASGLLVVPALLLGTSAAHAQAIYPTPDAAANAFVDAVSSNDHDALQQVLGKDAQRIMPPGSIDENDIYQFLDAWSKEHRIVSDPVAGGVPAKAHLEVGTSGWTLPIPLVESSKGWHFDTAAARDEVLTRRIGRNENAAMLTTLAYVDAQNDYHDLTKHYAQRLVSTPDKHDGLYWPTAQGEAESPLGPLAAMMGQDASTDDAYHGYHYRILSAQGSHAPGGARSYVQQGMLTQGFALIAWPADYGKTGLTTFIVNQDGQLYQKNLGRQTARVAESIRSFDPDSSWQNVVP